MKNSWSQPSLSRDFALLAAAILFVLFLISAWVSYATYVRHAEFVSTELEREGERIESLLAQDMQSASYMLTSLGRQIILNKETNLVEIAQILKSFDSRGFVYSVFSFINNRQQIAVSSNRGVIDMPVDISDRDYVKMAVNEPWKMHIGQPIEGRVSGRWVIPVAMGITDYTGKFVGSLLISMDIDVLTERIHRIVKRDGINFVIVNRNLTPLSQESTAKEFIARNFPTKSLASVDFNANKSGLVSHGNLFFGASIYSYYHASSEYPYVILLNYDAYANDENVRNQLWSRLLQVLGFATFFVLFLWIMRARMIRPVLQLTEVANNIARGEKFVATPQGGPEEIEGLAAQMGRISEYIQEIKRIEDELRNKMFMLKKDKELAHVEKRSKAEFLDYICQELRTPVNSVIGYAQMMKDQLYGPIENRKYRQCATDIYQESTAMLAKLSSLLEFNKAQDEYKPLEETYINVVPVIQQTLAATRESAPGTQLPTVELQAEENLPLLCIAEFRLRQIVRNMLIFLYGQPPGKRPPMLRITKLHETKDNSLLVLLLYTDDAAQPGRQELFAMASDLTYPRPPEHAVFESVAETQELVLELAKHIISLHQGNITLWQTENGLCLAAIFTASRLKYPDNAGEE